MTEPIPYRAPAPGAPARLPPPTSQPWTVRSVLTRAWRVYVATLVQLTLASMVLGGAMTAMGFVATRIMECIPSGASVCTPHLQLFVRQLEWIALAGFAVALGSSILVPGVTSMQLAALRSRPITFGTMTYRFERWISCLGWLFLIDATRAAGSMFPALWVVSIGLPLPLVFAVVRTVDEDERSSAFDKLRMVGRFWRRTPIKLTLFLLVVTALVWAGSITRIGALVTTPVTSLALAVVYLRERNIDPEG